MHIGDGTACHVTSLPGPDISGWTMLGHAFIMEFDQQSRTQNVARSEPPRATEGGPEHRTPRPCDRSHQQRGLLSFRWSSDAANWSHGSPLVCSLDAWQPAPPALTLTGSIQI